MAITRTPSLASSFRIKFLWKATLAHFMATITKKTKATNTNGAILEMSAFMVRG